MEQQNGLNSIPILILPKNCTNLETNDADNMILLSNVHITAMDTDGKKFILYSGTCNVNLIDTLLDLNIPEISNNNNIVPTGIDDDVFMVDLDDADPSNHMYPNFTQSQVWMDPITSPHTFNNCDVEMFQDCSLYEENRTNHIIDTQYNTNMPQNICDYNESLHGMNNDNYEVAGSIIQLNTMKNIPQNTSLNNPYVENEFECGMYMSQMPEEVTNDNGNEIREEQEYTEVESENTALKQLKSLDTQSVVKQRKTILYLGNDSQNGQTVYKMNVTSHKGSSDELGISEDSIIFDESVITTSSNKQYHCGKCNRIFDDISSLKRHNKTNDHDYYPSMYEEDTISADESKMKCHDCGRRFKSEEKFILHCMKHGDPDLECEKCHKVLSSKFSLKNHLRIHTRKYPCKLCTKSFTRKDRLVSHSSKRHFTFMCDHCDFTSLEHSEHLEHTLIHREDCNTINDDFNETLLLDNIVASSPVEQDTTENTMSDNEEQAAEDMAIVIANELFQMSSKSKDYRKCKKICGVCSKPFNRVSDLKRHLIEHVIRNTLDKTPVSDDGTLNMLCEICHKVCFSKVDKYKAHLRKHANLTLYKCTFCNKSFSDSSNFSKHKKVHGSRYLQCDMCQRKFNTKKMMANHIAIHEMNPPINCSDCNKVFHFESQLKKHIRTTHRKELVKTVRCKFCQDTFKSLKQKWDHEWEVHKARKSIIDCLACGSKFRKYTDLKKHCSKIHNTLILPAKRLMKNNVIKVGPF